MKKTLLLALTLIAVGCSEPIPRSVRDLVQQGDVWLDRETMRPYSGPVYVVDGTRVRLSGTLEDGKYSSLEIYRENGELSSRATFKDGERCGEWIDESGETVTYDPCSGGPIGKWIAIGSGVLVLLLFSLAVMVRGSSWTMGRKTRAAWEGLQEIWLRVIVFVLGITLSGVVFLVLTGNLGKGLQTLIDLFTLIFG